jgi:hypothetical protein
MHREMEPVQSAHLGRNRAQTRTTVGERGHFGGVGPVSSARWISVLMSVSAPMTAPKTCRQPATVSTLPTRTSQRRSPSSRLRMKVESNVTVIAAAAVGGFSAAASVSRLPPTDGGGCVAAGEEVGEVGAYGRRRRLNGDEPRADAIRVRTGHPVNVLPFDPNELPPLTNWSSHDLRP